MTPNVVTPKAGPPIELGQNSLALVLFFRVDAEPSAQNITRALHLRKSVGYQKLIDMFEVV